jgi:hypothetical protein
MHFGIHKLQLLYVYRINPKPLTVKTFSKFEKLIEQGYKSILEPLKMM